MLLSSPADIRRVAILAGALPHDLIQPTTGLLPLSREDIESALRASNTKVRSRGWQEFLVGAMMGLVAARESTHVKQLLPDKKKFSRVKGTGLDLYRLYKDNKWQGQSDTIRLLQKTIQYQHSKQGLQQELQYYQQEYQYYQPYKQLYQQHLVKLRSMYKGLSSRRNIIPLIVEAEIEFTKYQTRIEYYQKCIKDTQKKIEDCNKSLTQQTQKKKNYDTTKKALRANQ